MNSDIRLSVTFFQHRKTKKLAKKLGDEAVLSLLKLWSRVAIEKPDGILSGWDHEDISLEADYGGDSEKFLDCLMVAGFIDHNEIGYSLHNWATRQGWVAKSVERSDKSRMSRMARTHPDIYAELTADGVSAVSRELYDSLTKAQRSVNESLKVVNDTLSPAPAPVPDPVPVPSPAPVPVPVPTPMGSDNKLPCDCVKFSKDFYSYLSENGGKKTPTKKDIDSGADTIDKLVRIDKWGLEDEIKPALRWATQDHFWSKQVRSLSPLRKKADNGDTKFANLFASYSARDVKSKGGYIEATKDKDYRIN